MSGRLALADDEVHLWQVALDLPDDAVAALACVLGPDEQARRDRLVFERDRRAFTVARGRLRGILGQYLGVEPSDLRFAYGRHGKPALPGAGLQFNLSHTRGLMLLALARGRAVGVDVEHIHPVTDVEKLVARFFSPAERAAFHALPADGRLEGFFRGWTRKEAYLKATGDGLARPLASFDVSLAVEEAPLLRVADEPYHSGGWSLRSLTPGPGYVAAVCAEGQVWRLTYCWTDDAGR